MAFLDDYRIDSVENSWTAVDQKTAAQATATKAAEPSRCHVVCKVDASYESSAQSGEVTLYFGLTLVARKAVHGSGAIDFGDYGLQASATNQAVEARLTAGAGGIDGDVTMIGYTTYGA
jgi:hypothetical protein